jgi:hypothetical protein
MHRVARGRRRGTALEMTACMLKHTKSKKLALRAETVRSLADRDLVAINGAHLDTIVQCQINTASRFPICQPTLPVNLCLMTKTILC